MKITVNNKIELNTLTLITERKDSTNTTVLSLTFMNESKSVIDIEKIFENINVLSVTRTDLDKHSTTENYSAYNCLVKVERKVTDEANSLIVTLKSKK